MTPPKTVTVGRVVLKRASNGFYLVKGDLSKQSIGVCKTVYGDFRAWYRPCQIVASADSLEAAASALIEKLRALRDALADVLGEEEGT